jgi:acetyl esterase
MSTEIDPEMAAFLQAALAFAESLPPDWKQAEHPERELQERIGRLTRRDLPALFAVSDHWMNARGRRIFCRLYRPSAAAVLPVIVYFHGGGWYFSSVDTHDGVARRLAAESGLAVLSVDYALSPEVRFPHALEECTAVVRALHDEAAEWGIDPSQIFVAGDSAGGALAFGTALLLRERRGPQLSGVFAAYPACDADFETPSYREFGNSLPLTADKMRFFWENYVRDAADMRNPLASPLRADVRGLPPVLIQIAELDVLRDEGVAMGDHLRKAGVAVDVEVYSGLSHGFLRAAQAVSKADAAIKSAGAWFRARVT